MRKTRSPLVGGSAGGTSRSFFSPSTRIPKTSVSITSSDSNSFDEHGLTEIRVLELAERFSFTHIFAQSEHDILRAAELRGWLGLAGQSYDSALGYRDKVRMKTLARAGGVATPVFAALATPLELHRFALAKGFPIVVKPRRGAGSRGVQVIGSLSEMKRFLEHPLPAQYMVEAYRRRAQLPCRRPGERWRDHLRLRLALYE